MYNIRWTKILKTGMVAMFGSRVFFTILKVYLMSVPSPVLMLIQQMIWCAGAILVVLSFPKWRMETGETSAGNLLLALRPSEIVLIVFLILFAAGSSLTAFIIEWVSNFLSAIGSFGMLIYFFVILKKHIRSARKMRRQRSVSEQTPGSAGNSSVDHCSRCGKAMTRSNMFVLNGEKLCRGCIGKAEEEEAKKRKTDVCCSCDKTFPQFEMILVDDRLYCKKCFSKKFSKNA